MAKEKKTEKLPEQGSDSPFQRFEKIAKKVVTVPKKELDKKQKQ